MTYDAPVYNRYPQTQLHTVVSIEYFRGEPHQAVTTTDPTGEFVPATFWDLDFSGDDKQDLMFFESGGGGSALKLETYAIEGSGCQVWINPIFRDKMTLVLRNTELIDEPILLTDYFASSPNPFITGREVGKITYCEKCEKYYDEDYCPDHDCEFTEGAEEEWASRSEMNPNQ